MDVYDLVSENSQEHTTSQEELTESLIPGAWLSESPINFLGGLLQQHFADVTVHSTFFYTLLRRDGPENVSRWHIRKNKRPLFQRGHVIIPVNLLERGHWILVTLDMKQHIVYYIDSLVALGNISKTAQDIFARLLGYLSVVHSKEPGSHFDRSEWQLQYPKVSQQVNGYDCGLYVCYFMIQAATKRDITKPFPAAFTRRQLINVVLEKEGAFDAILRPPEEGRRYIIPSEINLGSLDDGFPITDEPINAFGKLITYQFPEVMALSSHFYPNLCQAGIESVENWTRKTKGIFQHRHVFFPLLRRNHWSLINVDLRNQVIESMDGIPEPDAIVRENVITYLAHMHEREKNSPLDINQWKVTSPNVDDPADINDTGLAVCFYMTLVCRNEDRRSTIPTGFTRENLRAAISTGVTSTLW